MKPLGAHRAFIGIAPEHHLAVFARRHASKRLQIALTLGNHPAVLIAAALSLLAVWRGRMRWQRLRGSLLSAGETTAMMYLIMLLAELFSAGSHGKSGT